MQLDPETIKITQRLRQAAERHPHLPESIIFRLAAAYLLDAPAETVRSLNAEIVASLDQEVVLEQVVAEIGDSDKGYPNALSVIAILRYALRLLRGEDDDEAQDDEQIALAQWLEAVSAPYPQLPESIVYRLAAANLRCDVQERQIMREGRFKKTPLPLPLHTEIRRLRFELIAATDDSFVLENLIASMKGRPTTMLREVVIERLEEALRVMRGQA